MRGDRPAWALIGLAACQPWGPPVDDPPCERVRPEVGATVVAELGCGALIPAGGEGRVGADLYLANRSWRVVIRHPLDAQTVGWLAGGTVADAAPWTEPDTVHEAIPIVGGGWLTEAAMTVLPDGASFTGPVGPLPGLPPPAAAGEVRTVRYRVEPDSPWLVAEGAEGFWIHPRGDVELLDGIAVGDDRAVGANGTVQDLGGAFAVWGTDRLVIATDTAVWEARAASPVRIAGEAPGAAVIALYRAGERVGRVPIAGPSFSFRADATVDAVRAEAPGFAPSAFAAPGTGLELALGAPGALTLDPRWPDELPHWFRARWTATDGRAGEEILGPRGGTLALGAGVYDLTLSAGPAFAVVRTRVEIRPEAEGVLPVRLPTKIAAGPYAIAGFRRPADRSWDWRGSDLTAALQAAADGLAYATFTPPGDVAAVSATEPEFPRLKVRNGVRLDGDGYSVASWSWGNNAREAVHGGPRSPPVAPLEDAAVLHGGPDDARTLHVDLGWLALAGTPFTVRPAPDLVALGPPGEGAGAWAPWLAWLDAQRPVVPTGPATWVKVADPAWLGHQDVEQSLARGAVCAGTGPLIKLTVDGIGPGDELPPDPSDTGHTGIAGTGATGATGDTGAPGPRRRRVEVSVAPIDGLSRLVLLGAGGQQTVLPLGAVTIDLALEGSWVAAAAWSDAPDGPWAVTGPVWLRAP